MAFYSYNAIVSPGITNVIPLTFPYLAQSDVHCYVGGVEVTGFTFVGGGIQLVQTAVSLTGLVVVVRRITAGTLPDVTFLTGGLAPSDLNTQATQLLYMAQEALDSVAISTDGHLDAVSRRIENVVDPVALQDAATRNWTQGAIAAQLAATIITKGSPVGFYTDPKDFGALGDGAHDDTSAINAALIAAATNGTKAVFLRPATAHAISSTLSVPLGVSLVGMFSSNDDYTKPGSSSVKALASFPKSQPMVSFAQNWTGRFEGILLDGATFATCGFRTTDMRGAYIANVGVRGLGNNATSDYCWLMQAIAVSSSLNVALNVIFNKYNIAAHTNGLVCIGTEVGGVETAAVTDNLFLNCDLSVAGSGTPFAGNGYGLNLAVACDNNVFDGCFISINGAGDILCLNNQGTYDALVGENYFTNCAFVSASGNMMVADFLYGPCTFNGCFFQTAQMSLGAHSWVDIRQSTFGDAPTLPTSGVTLTGSPFTFTNNKGVPVTLKFWGGAFSAISLTRRTGAALTGGTPTASTGLGVVSGAYYDILLEPTDSLTLTYTGSPTMFYFPQR